MDKQVKGSDNEFEDAIQDFIEGGSFSRDVDGQGIFDIVTDTGSEDKEQEKKDEVEKAGSLKDEKEAKIEGEKKGESDKKVEIVRKRVKEMKINERCELQWNLLDKATRNDIEWDKMGRFLEFMDRK